MSIAQQIGERSESLAESVRVARRVSEVRLSWSVNMAARIRRASMLDVERATPRIREIVEKIAITLSTLS